MQEHAQINPRGRIRLVMEDLLSPNSYILQIEGITGKTLNIQRETANTKKNGYNAFVFQNLSRVTTSIKQIQQMDELMPENWNFTSLGLSWLGNSFPILQNIRFVFFPFLSPEWNPEFTKTFCKA